ncbi:protein FMP32, mitochondrial-like [Iris pallida]|uniref:Protein FMP32, mitochondrial-like n=1 Tax=Iris pallida TaxID=29817 RepID=A0AAX6GSY0_IRIPA|nr:protein FMP32, mitochondrial-like [Iris pallida]
MSAAGILRRGGALLGSQSRSAFAIAAANRSVTSLLSESSSPAAASSSSSSLSSSSLFSSGDRRGQVLHISQLVRSNGKRAFLVDTLALVRRLEKQGLPSNQAEAITSAITEVLNDSLENVAVLCHPWRHAEERNDSGGEPLQVQV